MISWVNESPGVKRVRVTRRMSPLESSIERGVKSSYWVEKVRTNEEEPRMARVGLNKSKKRVREAKGEEARNKRIYRSLLILSGWESVSILKFRKRAKSEILRLFAALFYLEQTTPIYPSAVSEVPLRKILPFTPG